MTKHAIKKIDEQTLSLILKAVSDTTRRSLLTQLVQQGPTQVTDLASYYDMSLNAISKHIKVLEKAGLVTRKTLGRSHWIEVHMEVVSEVDNWFSQLKSIWEMRFNKLEDVLTKGKNDDD